jgi:hypothetical protein
MTAGCGARNGDSLTFVSFANFCLKSLRGLCDLLLKGPILARRAASVSYALAFGTCLLKRLVAIRRGGRVFGSLA